MSSDRQLTRVVRSWLEDGVNVMPDRVLDEVLAQLPVTPQRRHFWQAWRNPIVRTSKLALTGVAVLLIVAIGLGLYLTRPSNLGPGATTSPNPPQPQPTQVSPTIGPSPSLVAAPRPFPGGGPLTAGRYVVDNDTYPLRAGMTLESDWFVWGAVASDVFAFFHGSPDAPAGYGMIFHIGREIYANPCNTADGLTDPGPSTEDFASAVAAQPGTEASPPTDTTVSGFQATYIEYTFTGEGAECGAIARWSSSQGSRQASPGEHDQLWIVDVDGTQLVIDAFSFEQTPEAGLAEMQRIVESLELEPKVPPAT